ncbi:hypothetical protein WMF17_04605 [Sorangium sp. So ce362]
MACPAHDLERVIAADGHPRHACRAEVVERDGLPCRVIREELGPGDARKRQEAAQPRSQGLTAYYPDHPRVRVGLALHRAQQRHQVRLDSEPPGEPALGRLLLRAQPIDAAVHVDYAVVEVDVAPPQCFELPGAEVEVDGQRDDPAPVERHSIAIHEGQELGGVEIALRPLDAAVRTDHISAGVVITHAQRSDLGAVRVLEHLAHNDPHALHGLPGMRACGDLGVQRLYYRFDLCALDIGDRLLADGRLDVRLEGGRVFVDRHEPALVASGVPAPEVLGDSLARADRRRVAAVLWSQLQPFRVLAPILRLLPRHRLRAASRKVVDGTTPIIQRNPDVPMISMSKDRASSLTCHVVYSL